MAMAWRRRRSQIVGEGLSSTAKPPMTLILAAAVLCTSFRQGIPAERLSTRALHHSLCLPAVQRSPRIAAVASRVNPAGAAVEAEPAHMSRYQPFRIASLQ